MTAADKLCEVLEENRKSIEIAIHQLVVEGTYDARRAAMKGEVLLSNIRTLVASIDQFSKAIANLHDSDSRLQKAPPIVKGHE